MFSSTVEKKAAKEEKPKGTSVLNIKLPESASCVKRINIITSLWLNKYEEAKRFTDIFTVDRVPKEIQVSEKKGILFAIKSHFVC